MMSEKSPYLQIICYEDDLYFITLLHPQFLAFLGVEFGGPHHLGNHHLVKSNLRFLPQGIPTTPSVSQCRISFLSYRFQVWSLSQIFVKLSTNLYGSLWFELCSVFTPKWYDSDQNITYW